MSNVKTRANQCLKIEQILPEKKLLVEGLEATFHSNHGLSMRYQIIYFVLMSGPGFIFWGGIAELANKGGYIFGVNLQNFLPQPFFGQELRFL